MLNVLLAYVSHDGQSAKISERISTILQRSDCAVELCNLAHTGPRKAVDDYAGVLVGGPIHRGSHPALIRRFVVKHCQILCDMPSAFFSVSLSAAGNEDQRRDADRCLESFLEETGWQPMIKTVVAGALLYRRYGFFKRWLMKMIVAQAGGDTDTSRDYVYTDWEAVDRFAQEFADELALHTSEPMAPLTARC